MALSNQSAPAFFLSPAKLLKGNPVRWVWQLRKKGRRILPSPTIPVDYLLRMVKSRLMPSWNWQGPGTSITVIWCHRQVNLLNFNRGFDEISSLKQSSGASDSGLL
jgi:hypothetical protein